MAVSPTPSFTIVRDNADAGALKRAVIAIGNFDGVHRGHRAVIGKAIARARALSVPAAALTLEPHPRGYFRPNDPLFRLSDESQKLRLLAGSGPRRRHRAHLQCRARQSSGRRIHRTRAGGSLRGVRRRHRLRFSFRQGSRRLAGVSRGRRQGARISGRYRSRARGRRPPGLLRHDPRGACPPGVWSRRRNCSAIPGSCPAR